MQTKVVPEKLEAVKADVLIVGMFEKETNEYTKKLDKILNNEISVSLKKKEFSGEFGEMKAINTLGKIDARKVLVVGLGKKKEYSLEVLRRASALSLKAGRNGGSKVVASLLHTFGIDRTAIADRVQAMCEGALLGSYQFVRFKTQEKEKIKKVEQFVVIEKVIADATKGMRKANILSSAVMHVRDLVNIPANIVTPTYLANEALKLKKLGVKVRVFNKKDAKRMGMNAFLAVTSGSAQEPKFVVMEYGSGKDTVAVVGKGITFDSGGLDIKPSKYMEDMKQDMAGAATVIGIMEAIARLKLKKRVVGAFVACENMPSATAYRPGDVITTYNKKTIEVMNTDAEGRVVLSDALAYMEKQYKPRVIIDLATLTGACIVALGYWATGLLSKDDKLCEELIKAGEETSDRVWRLPLWDEYVENMKSDVADVRNVGRSYDAGTIEGAVFLQNFVDKAKWAHLDIAGTAWDTAGKPYHPKGATGIGVRLLTEYLKRALS